MKMSLLYSKTCYVLTDVLIYNNSGFIRVNHRDFNPTRFFLFIDLLSAFLMLRYLNLEMMRVIINTSHRAKMSIFIEFSLHLIYVF